MTFWIKTSDGNAVKLRDRDWHAKIYASGSAAEDPDYVYSKVKSSGLVRSIDFSRKKKSILDSGSSTVLEITLNKADGINKLAKLLQSNFRNPSTFKLYNVDVMPEQQYFYEHEIFPSSKFKSSLLCQGEVAGKKVHFFA